MGVRLHSAPDHACEQHNQTSLVQCPAVKTFTGGLHVLSCVEAPTLSETACALSVPQDGLYAWSFIAVAVVLVMIIGVIAIILAATVGM